MVPCTCLTIALETSIGSLISGPRMEMAEILTRGSETTRHCWPIDSAPRSDPRVPSVAPALVELFQTISDCEAADVLHTLIAELTGNPQTKRTTMAERKVTTVHPVNQESLRMQGIVHVDALPPFWLQRK